MERKAFAKINISLDITGRRYDGYHLIDSIFDTISLCDTLSGNTSDIISVRYSQPLPPGPSCIVTAAANEFFRRAGITGGFAFSVTKNIPAGAGLGGGSADAAAALAMLNTSYGCPLSPNALAEAAKAVGADVPFALAGGTARVSGIGEKITSFSLASPLYYLILKPESGLSTQEVYHTYDISPHYFDRPDTHAVVRALSSGNLRAMRRCGGNVLTNAAISLLPEIGSLLELLRMYDADYVSMTGSGSAVFGMFGEKQKGLDALEDAKNHCSFAVFAQSARQDTAFER